MGPGTSCRLRRTIDDLSGGTRVAVVKEVGEHGRHVQTESPIPVMRHSSWFDGDGLQRHKTEVIKTERRELLVDVTDLVAVRRR